MDSVVDGDSRRTAVRQGGMDVDTALRQSRYRVAATEGVCRYPHWQNRIAAWQNTPTLTS